MNYTKMKELLDQCPQMWGTMDQGYQKWEEYVEARRELYSRLASENENANLTSELNWMLRSQYAGCHQLGIDVFPGDVCYMDFGQAYKYEIGYQHFGIVISICFGKALVVPMTSNPVQYAQAFDPTENPTGRKHLMRLGRIGSMNKPSVLFLNDMKFVNTSRIIDVKGHLSTGSDKFMAIRKRLLEEVSGSEYDPGTMLR
jgi:hypothetical protein